MVRKNRGVSGRRKKVEKKRGKDLKQNRTNGKKHARLATVDPSLLRRIKGVEKTLVAAQKTVEECRKSVAVFGERFDAFDKMRERILRHFEDSAREAEFADGVN